MSHPLHAKHEAQETKKTEGEGAKETGSGTKQRQINGGHVFAHAFVLTQQKTRRGVGEHVELA